MAPKRAEVSEIEEAKVEVTFPPLRPHKAPELESEDDFPDWLERFRGYISDVLPNYREELEDLGEEAGTSNAQDRLYTAITLATRKVLEAKLIVKRMSGSDRERRAFQTWSALRDHFEGASGQRINALFCKLREEQNSTETGIAYFLRVQETAQLLADLGCHQDPGTVARTMVFGLRREYLAAREHAELFPDCLKDPFRCTMRLKSLVQGVDADRAEKKKRESVATPPKPAPSPTVLVGSTPGPSTSQARRREHIRPPSDESNMTCFVGEEKGHGYRTCPAVKELKAKKAAKKHLAPAKERRDPEASTSGKQKGQEPEHRHAWSLMTRGIPGCFLTLTCF